MKFFARWFLWPVRLIFTLFAWFMISIVMILWLAASFVVGRAPREAWIKSDLGGLAGGYREMLHFVFLTSPQKE